MSAWLRSAAGALVFASAGLPAAATCTPSKWFSSVSSSGYHYVLMGTDNAQDPASILGRFWQPGARASGNEGTYDESGWIYLHPVQAPDAYYLYGTLGDPGVVGCPTGEMIVLVETTSLDASDASFVAARVSETPGGEFDFDAGRLGVDMRVRPYPRLSVTSSRRVGTEIHVDLAFDDVGDGFFGLPGMVPQGTITGYRIYQRLVDIGQPEPDRLASGWTLRRIVPYAGTAPTSTGLAIDCAVPGKRLWIATGLEFDSADVAGTYVGRARMIDCRTDPSDADSDGLWDWLDNCVWTYNPSQSDVDGDGPGDACDTCPSDANASQSDLDDDGEGDRCDLDDGLIYLYAADSDYSEWQAEAGYESWNSYRGLLEALRTTGEYTQEPGSNPEAARQCGLSDPWAFDPAIPDAGSAAFFLTTGVAAGVESSLGTAGSGAPRSNAHPCP